MGIRGKNMFMKKKIIIGSIIFVALVVIGVISGIIIHNVLEKKELDRRNLALNEAYNALNNYTKTHENDENFSLDNLFGYTFIVEMGDKYSDYIFIYDKTNKLEFETKVNYNHDDKTALNKDKTTCELLTPKGTTFNIKRFFEVAKTEYNIENVYIYYGTQKMGFANTKQPNEFPDTYDQPPQEDPNEIFDEELEDNQNDQSLNGQP